MWKHLMLLTFNHFGVNRTYATRCPLKYLQETYSYCDNMVTGELFLDCVFNDLLEILQGGNIGLDILICSVNNKYTALVLYFQEIIKNFTSTMQVC